MWQQAEPCTHSTGAGRTAARKHQVQPCSRQLHAPSTKNENTRLFRNSWDAQPQRAARSPASGLPLITQNRETAPTTAATAPYGTLYSCTRACWGAGDQREHTSCKGCWKTYKRATDGGVMYLDTLVCLGLLLLCLQGVLGLVAQRHEGQEEHVCQELQTAAISSASSKGFRRKSFTESLLCPKICRPCAPQVLTVQHLHCLLGTRRHTQESLLAMQTHHGASPPPEALLHTHRCWVSSHDWPQHQGPPAGVHAAESRRRNRN